MPSAKELREELRAMRKESGARPISKMKVADVSAEIERLKGMRETTPAPAATPSGKSVKAAPATESVKKAKEAEFPVKPSAIKTKEKPATKTAPAPEAPEKKKSSKLAKLLAMLESDDE